MTRRREDLISAIEAGLFLQPDTPGYISLLPFDGVRGYVGALAHPYVNGVGLSRLTDARAARTIGAIRDFYAERGKAFTWMVGPFSTPSNLGALLAEAGLRKIIDLAGMAFTDFRRPIASRSGVAIRKARPDEHELIVLTTVRAGGLSEEFSRFVVKMRQEVRGELEIDTYLAFADGIETPVGYAMMTYFPDSPIVELGGAATVAEHRGKGVYTSLLSQRLADARARGVKVAVIQAARATSAPICARHGFVEMCALEDYLWVPDCLADDLKGEWGLDGSLVVDCPPQPPS